MTTVYADNFTDNTTGSTLSLESFGWTVDGLPVTTSSNQRRTGVNSFLIDYNENIVRGVTFDAGATKFYFSFALRLETLPSGGNNLTEIFRYQDSAASTMFGLQISSTGNYRLIAGGNIYTSTETITAGVWYWVQGELVVSDTVGSIELRDGSGNVIRSVTGIDTKPGTDTQPARIQLGATATSSTNSDGRITDLHIWDDSGSICNTWTGATQIDNLYPSAAGNATQWTPSTGANWECLDEVPSSTTDYVYANAEATNTTDLYTFQDLTENPTTIFSVVVTAYAFKDNAGPGNLELLVDSSTGSPSMVSSGGKALPANGYARVFHVQETDPGTGSAWDAVGINGAEFGIRVGA